MNLLKWWHGSKNNFLLIFLLLGAIILISFVFLQNNLLLFSTNKEEINDFHQKVAALEKEASSLPIQNKITQKSTNQPQSSKDFRLGEKVIFVPECVRGYVPAMNSSPRKYGISCGKDIVAYYGLDKIGLNDIRAIESLLEQEGWNFDRNNEYFFSSENGVASGISNYSISAHRSESGSVTVQVHPKGNCGIVTFKDVCKKNTIHNYLLTIQYSYIAYYY